MTRSGRLPPLGRRAFAATVASALTACRAPTSSHPKLQAPSPPANAAPPPPPEISTNSVATAESILGITLTEQERAQLLEPLETQLALVQLRRDRPMSNARVPALTFSPLLRPSASVRTPPPRWSRAPVPAAPLHDADIAFASVATLGRWLRARKVTSVQLTTIALARLQTHGRRLESVVSLRTKEALADAAKADAALTAGDDRGPLHGIPYGIKDLFDTKALPTTWGARPFVDRQPATDATVVRRLAGAGAVLVAKLSTGALAYGDIWFDGRTKNPWNPVEGSSGSSAGPAAAVAAGLVPFAVGTETLGSIVSPAMRCGVTGLRPTFGRVSRAGCMSLCWSLDKVGPLTRDVEDAAMVLAAIEGPDTADPASRAVQLAYDAAVAVRGRVVGYDPATFDGPTATALDRAVLPALERLGVELVPVKIPDLPYDALLVILFAESATAFEQLTLADQDDTLTWQGDNAWPNTFRAARFISAIDYIGADRLRREVMQAFDALFEPLDALVGPSFAGSMLTATNFTGHPSLTLRIGFEQRAPEPGTDGRPPAQTREMRMPRGITLWGPVDTDGRLCELGLALQTELGVAAERPPGFESSS